ncbi:MAG TPA: hypothetical protein VFM93_10215 [Candidatus Limnocylindria bacterium]|nr:hypothetical protein [Candidatus Limnocylindria bacterium]
MIRTALASTLAIVLALASATPVIAHGPCTDTGAPGASEYGLLHVSSHTPHGPPDAFHNPGTHMGYSACLDVH